MGGRTFRELETESQANMWIREVSDSRLESYSRLSVSSGFDTRVTGDSRSDHQKLFFSDLIQKEKSRRGLK